MNSDLLARLNKWIADNYRNDSPYAIQSDHNKAYELRSIVGEMMKEVNEASSIYKQSMRSPTPEVSAKARRILDELENWGEILKSLSVIESLMAEDSKHPTKRILGRPFLNALHYLQRSRFTDEQIERVRAVAQHGGQTNSADFPDEVHQEGMEKLLRNAIYNVSDARSKTLKVVREVLQNAVDATDPKGKPHLASRPGFAPEIRIDYSLYKQGDQYLVDMVFEDKGVGMDWDTLSKKFFVTFESGKKNDAGAAGGFGIAKALIQDAPEHGWSVDTGGIHTNRFQKNVFFGSRKGEGYTPPESDIRKEKDGVTLSLHGLPFVTEDQVKDLCRVYATNGRVKIFFKGEEQEPRFTLESSDIKPLDTRSFVSAVSETDSEKEVAEKVLEKNKKEMEERLEDIAHVSGTKNHYRFLLKKSKGAVGGSLYVMVNGQYQFHEEKYLPKLDLILAVETTARPGDDDYPLDPGREYLRGPIKSAVDALVGTIKKVGDMMSQDELFKDGIESLMVNEDSRPMTIDEEESTTEKKDMLMRVFQSLTGGAFVDGSSSEEEPDAVTQDAPARDRGPEPPREKGTAARNPEDDPSEEEPAVLNPDDTPEEKQKQIEAAARKISSIVGSESAFDMPTIVNMVKDAVGTSESRVDYNNKIKSIIDGLTTPGHILIQKNFVARKVVSENAQLTGEMLIVWQKAIRMIIQKMTDTVSRFGDKRSRPFVPGLIYSDEALGLYMPAKNDRKFDSICVNPITLAAHILPELFREKLESPESGESAFDLLDQVKSSDKSSSSDTPTNRVSKFLFHLAVHEVCHFLNPDGWGSENFHRNISKMEVICHDEYEQIRKVVRTHIKSLRNNAKKLITLIAKNKPRRVTESFLAWMERKPMAVLESPEPKRKAKMAEAKADNFREFLRMFGRD